MNNLHGVKPTKPKSILYRSLNFKFKDLFKHLGKAVIDGSIGNFSGVAKDLVDAVSDIGFNKEDNNELIWILIFKSLEKAIVELINDHLIIFEKLPEESKIEKLCNELEENMDAPDFFIYDSFFKSPGTIDFIVKAENFFLEWLKEIAGLDSSKARSISSRLPSYFVYSLKDEWRNNSTRYDGLKEFFDTPFTKASKEEQNWSFYHSWLQKQCEEKVFEETFSLRQIYIPLRGYYKKKEHQNESVNIDKIVVDLEDELDKWVDLRDPSDSLRIISGGPGYGKSSFLKIFAADQSEKKNLRVLFVPLHFLDLEDNDIKKAIDDFIENDYYLEKNPINFESGNKQLLIIFDGLDELTMQGKVGASTAKYFIEKLKKMIYSLNRQTFRIQSIISGRDLVVQENKNKFNKSKQILHLLPYYVSEKYYYRDDKGILSEDQRDIWWKNYGNIIGKPNYGMPEELKNKNFIEITSQPLLNYLVALTYGANKNNFSEQLNINSIYNNLITAVYKRKWENDKHASIKNSSIEEDDFISFLEEVAVAAWHNGNSRIIEVLKVKNYCEERGLINILEIFEHNNKSFPCLFLAFYFRKSGCFKNSEKTFEFTHKSFGEYLTARRIVYIVKNIDTKFKDNINNLNYDEKSALIDFLKIFGKNAIDEYLFEFIENEVFLHDKNEVYSWQETLCRLIEYVSLKCMPMENLDLSTFQEECIWARNAEEALIVLLSACSSFTEKVTEINWPDEDSFMFLYKRLLCKKGNVFAIENLKFIDLKNCNLKGADLSVTYLKGANLTEADLSVTYLKGAYLKGANLTEANLRGANLTEADLGGANLTGANLGGANLTGADLSEADLSEADLSEADLSAANLIEADLGGANLRDTKGL